MSDTVRVTSSGLFSGQQSDRRGEAPATLTLLEGRNARRYDGWTIALAASLALWAVIGGGVWAAVSLIG